MKSLELHENWKLRGGPIEGAVPATVPGCVHLDLLAAGEIEDPFYRDREVELMWIGQTEWTYETTFEAPAELLDSERVLLRCEGLDTLATLELNGEPLGEADNMFRIWTFDVRDRLVAGENTLTIRFAPAASEARARGEQAMLKAGGQGVYKVSGSSYLRKEPCNFGWDWGPMCVTAGIWRPIRLLGIDTARLDHVDVRQHHHDGAVDLTITAELDTLDPAPDVKLTASLFAPDGGDTPLATVELDEAGRACLRIDEPRLWWPNGTGDQPLYRLEVVLHDRGGEQIDRWSRRIGLRTIELQRELDQWGESFRFACNGVPFFAKGANWIPADVFQRRITDAGLRGLLADAAAANMNMLRVWGGGVYEDDRFYDLCDELGLCVWQDFMFACAAYPLNDPAFVENVRIEAVQNVRRLAHHACLALWCGNNELEQMEHLIAAEPTPGAMTWRDYALLFDRILPDVVAAQCPDVAYWPSSEHSPIGNRTDSRHPDWGDAHLWSVWHGRQPFEWYRTTTHRFCSEFGFQSFPEPRTIRGFTEPHDRHVNSYVMDKHQRSPVGNQLIITYMLDRYRLPTGFENTVWVSQIQHGLSIEYAVQHWRRNMPRCMGALYWQLNDCWPVASWASIDYHGRWKALHYFARRFFAPLMVSGVEDPEAGTVEIHVTCDELDPAPATLSWRATDLAGRDLRREQATVNPPSNGSALVATPDLSDLIRDHGLTNLLVCLSLEREGAEVSSACVLFTLPRHLDLVDPRLSTNIEPAGDGAFRVTLEAEAPALWAWLELEDTDAAYSDNFLWVTPGEPKTITVTPAEPMTADEFAARLRARSIWNTYQP